MLKLIIKLIINYSPPFPMGSWNLQFWYILQCLSIKYTQFVWYMPRLDMKTFKEIMHLHIIENNTPWGHEIYNCGRTFFGYHQYIFQLFDLWPGVKKIFKKLMHLHFTTFQKNGKLLQLCASHLIPSPLQKDALCKVWLKLIRLTWRKRLLNVVNVFSLFRYNLSFEKGRIHFYPRMLLAQFFRSWFSGSKENLKTVQMNKEEMTTDGQSEKIF